ncbi:ABC transporter permease [Cohnella mopanensis]|uniref:ABC transporter permease n=1 Tax=Cohnella mopanensis TaxID=2911966 RepID=UPI001EF8429C|nr:ABC-2 family transporter protein [Cohnella mopanensis]
MATTLTGLLRLYYWNMKLSVSRSMAYRLDFIIGVLTSILFSGTAPFLQYIFFTQTRGYPGWNLNQIMLFQGILLLWLGLRETLFGNVMDVAHQLVRKGDFDRLLVKPYPPLGTLLTSGFNLKGIGSLISGGALTIYAFSRLDVMPSPLQVLLALVSIVCSIILYMGVTTLLCTMVIMLVQVGRLEELVDRILGFGDYPINIYPRFLQQLFLTVFPFAIWAYVPSQALLDRLGSDIVMAVIGCFTVFAISVWIWNRSLNRYTSAGG